MSKKPANKTVKVSLGVSDVKKLLMKLSQLRGKLFITANLIELRNKVTPEPVMEDMDTEQMLVEFILHDLDEILGDIGLDLPEFNFSDFLAKLPAPDSREAGEFRELSKLIMESGQSLTEWIRTGKKQPN